MIQQTKMTRFDLFDPILLALLGGWWWVLVCRWWVVVGWWWVVVGGLVGWVCYWLLMDIKAIPGHTVDIMMSEAHLKCHRPRIRAR